MSWLSNLTPPGIKNIFRKEDDGSNSLWVKCGDCGDMIFNRELEAAQHVCPSCGHHMRLPVGERLKAFFDDGKYEDMATPEPVADPLKFRDEKKYVDRLKDYRKRTGRNDAMLIAAGTVEGFPMVAAIQNFDFMGGSMGMALGETLLRAVEEAIARRTPLVVFTASGGARMQEGILSLMQMPRTTIGVQMMREAKLPFIVVLTNPTTGGVTASYAMLGDVQIAEPGALVGFAGARVIEQTIREKLPEGFQRAEFLQAKGMVDMVVHRHELRSTLAVLLRVLTKDGAVAAKSAAIASIEPPGPKKIAAPKAKSTSIAARGQSLDKAAE